MLSEGVKVSTELEVSPPRETAITPMEMLSRAFMVAIEHGAALEVVDRILAQQREMMVYQDKIEFNDAMQRAQSAMTPIRADMNNPQTKSKYASYAKLDRALRPIYSKEGFALSFNTADCPLPDHERVLCEVTHGGYSKMYQKDMPNDGKGAKGGDVMTKTHASGAATSYGMRYLLKMIFNVAVGEDDTDGNTPSGPGLVEMEYLEYRDAIENADTLASLQRVYIEAYKKAQAMGDKHAMASFLEIKDKRKAELS